MPAPRAPSTIARLLSHQSDMSSFPISRTHWRHGHLRPVRSASCAILRIALVSAFAERTSRLRTSKPFCVPIKSRQHVCGERLARWAQRDHLIDGRRTNKVDTPCVGAADLALAIDAGAAMSDEEQQEVCNGIYAAQPKLLASVLGLTSLRVSRETADVLLDMLIALQLAVDASGQVFGDWVRGRPTPPVTAVDRAGVSPKVWTPHRW